MFLITLSLVVFGLFTSFGIYHMTKAEAQLRLHNIHRLCNYCGIDFKQLQESCDDDMDKMLAYLQYLQMLPK